LSLGLNYLKIYDLNVSYDVDDPAKPMIACYHCNLNTVSFFDSALNIASDLLVNKQVQRKQQVDSIGFGILGYHLL